MKKAELLEEVIGDLIDRGYPMEFVTDKGSKYLWQALNGYLSPKDFHIDEVHCCRETEDDEDIILVLAISITRYHIKGILTSEMLIEDHRTFAEVVWVFTQFLKNIFASIARSLKGKT